jgi:hypothetical protein
MLIPNCASPEAGRWRLVELVGRLLLARTLGPEKNEPQPLVQPGSHAGRLRVRGWGLTRRVTVNDNVEGLFRPRRSFFALMCVTELAYAPTH